MCIDDNNLEFTENPETTDNNQSTDAKCNDEKIELDFDRNLVVGMLSNVGVDPYDLLIQLFLGYKYRKNNKTLYEQTAVVPTMLITLYYSLSPGEIEFDALKKNFIKKYVKNESQIEGVNDTDIHGKEEIEGLGDMYEYLHSEEMEKFFSVYSLKDLHRKLFGRTPFPEYAGHYRNGPVYLKGSNVGLCDYYMVERELYALSGTIDYLHEAAKLVRGSGNASELFCFLDQVVELNCKLIWIHPFQDGNGRTVRAFINKLLEDAGLPPIYIKANERTAYHTAMNLANGEEHDFTAIKAFYRYKICDSILELDIEERYRRGNKEMNVTDARKKIKDKDKKN